MLFVLRGWESERLRGARAEATRLSVRTTVASAQ
jgi:hypothetical protein